MKFVTRALLGLGFLGALAGTALAQDSDEEAKKKILERVERRLKQEDERLLKEIEKLVDDALKGKTTPAEPKAPAKKGRGYIGIRADEVPADEQKALGIKGPIGGRDVTTGAAAYALGLLVFNVKHR